MGGLQDWLPTQLEGIKDKAFAEAFGHEYKHSDGKYYALPEFDNYFGVNRSYSGIWTSIIKEIPDNED